MSPTCIGLLLSLLCVAVTNWPAFLGGRARQDVKHLDTLPEQWNAESLSWNVALPGHGQSSPVVWEGHVFLTSVQGPNKDTYHTICLDLQSGESLWAKTIQNSVPVENSLYVSRAAPTPVVDANRVIALFESGDCVAYSHAGDELWRRQLGKDFGPLINEFGLGASPCQSEDLVFVLLEHDGPSCLLALDKQSGETRWKVEREPHRSWTSPAMMKIEGEWQVIVSSSGSVAGFAADTGALLWTFDEVGGNTGTTPIDCGQGRFLIAASAGRQGENSTAARTSNCMLRVTKPAGQWKVDKLWYNEEANPSWASPIQHQELAYWVNRAGVVYCIDAESGKTVYAKRTPQSCWATPIAAGDRIYLFGKDGTTTVLAAGKDFRILAECSFWDAEHPPGDNSLSTDESTEQRRQAAAMFKNPTVYGVAATTAGFVARIGNRVYCVQQEKR